MLEGPSREPQIPSIACMHQHCRQVGHLEERRPEEDPVDLHIRLVEDHPVEDHRGSHLAEDRRGNLDLEEDLDPVRKHVSKRS